MLYQRKMVYSPDHFAMPWSYPVKKLINRNGTYTGRGTYHNFAIYRKVLSHIDWNIFVGTIDCNDATLLYVSEGTICHVAFQVGKLNMAKTLQANIKLILFLLIRTSNLPLRMPEQSRTPAIPSTCWPLNYASISPILFILKI